VCVCVRVRVQSGLLDALGLNVL